MNCALVTLRTGAAVSSWSAMEVTPKAILPWQNLPQLGGSMTIEFCPLEADWGNIADWAAVLVAAFGAGAVLYLTKAANRTANASYRLAHELKVRDERLRLREAAVLAALLFPEVADAAAHFAKTSNTLRKEGARAWAVRTEDNLALLQNWAAGPGLERLGRESGRVHVFPRKLGEAIAMGLGRTYTASAAAEALAKANNPEEQQRVFDSLERNVSGAATCFRYALKLLDEVMSTEIA
ncbi:hypothetical protein D7Y50_02220 [Stenotrophomonas maltophilia]|uniref:hypothetical protein n=1 Tax=Stenotrophomonas maltophilia TaxID=40324 RepID=UPI0015DE598B|nr:hypothetical protein [Stenotrophomonas maltophilia]MBA0233049.1 hypothetical protein [Stenotrophomonas maltophilia]MBA0267007.1 hypothetical protein [Stenotrophomonas maltophilia]